MKATEIKLTIEGKWRCVICCQKWRSHKQMFAFVIYVELPIELSFKDSNFKINIA